MFQYAAKLVKAVDGDTVDLKVDLGFRVFTEQRFRLFGVNAPELHSTNIKEKAAGEKSRAFIEETLKGKTLTVTTLKDKTEKYGRFLATILVEGSVKSVNDLLVENKLAAAYFGGERPAFKE